MMDLNHLLPLAEEVISACRDKNLLVATAESCTGGLISGLMTEIAGSSAVVDRGFVTYSNAAKMDLVGVRVNDLNDFGAVSEVVARTMAEGALERSRADIAVSVTGIAGPGGGSKDKPVGTVHFALALKTGPTQHEHVLFQDRGRQFIRAQSVQTALNLILNAARSISPN